MMKQIFYITAVLIWNVTLAQNSSIPHLENRKEDIQLYVNNEPFLMFAGELHNSSTGSTYNMRPIWSRMAKKNLNTVIAAVSWELIEPEEGVFDFSLVDSMVLGARKENLKLVVLWFASWKNGKSMYTPEWVKTDTKRFPLVKDKKGKTLSILSTLGENSLKADTKAFTELMKHIKKIDSKEQTIIMVQVQNEIGVLDYRASYGGENLYMRDYSEKANQAFKGQVPSELLNYLEKNKEELYLVLEKAWAENGYKKEGNWEEVFGKGIKYEGEEWKTNFSYYTEEIFMAWNYAKYVGEIAKQGKNQYPLPMFANAWIKQSKAAEPGQYPSGGPLPHVIDIWRAAAPAIDFIAADIYAVEEFDWVCEEFTRSGNPLFIPETKVDPAAAARAFYAFGKFDAMGYAPFGIDGGGLILTASPNEHSFEKVYGCLRDFAPFINKYRGSDQMTGLFISKEKDSDQVELGDYSIEVRSHSVSGVFGLFGAEVEEEGGEDKDAAGFIVIQLDTNEFLVAGGVGGSIIRISNSKSNKWDHVGYASVDEITFVNGEMKTHRLNGDETAFGGPVIQDGEVKIFKIKMYGY